YRLSDAHGLAELAAEFRVIPLAEAAAAAFPVRPLTEAEAQSLSHGASLDAVGAAGPVAALAPDGILVALVEERDGRARPLAVFVSCPRSPGRRAAPSGGHADAPHRDDMAGLGGGSTLSAAGWHHRNRLTARDEWRRVVPVAGPGGRAGGLGPVRGDHRR